MQTVQKRSHKIERKDHKTNVKSDLSTLIIDKAAALAAVESINLNHLANKAVVVTRKREENTV